jgi:DNA-binding MarR family transcriptional regulator
MDLLRNRAAISATEGHNLNTYQAYIYRGKVVNHLTAEFQILLYLYLKPGISNLKISQVVDVSMTKFHTSLTRLVALGLVSQHRDPADGRSKLYRLSDDTQAVLDELHRQMFQWRAARS